MRAAYWTDGQNEIILTDESQSSLDDDALLAAARQLANNVGLKFTDDQMIIGEWIR